MIPTQLDPAYQKKLETFHSDWQRSKEKWKRQHKVWDFAWVNYRSMLTLNTVMGEDAMRAMGLSVHVPLTFQTVESLCAHMNQRKVEFTVKGKGLLNERKAKFLQKMDNVEWIRSGADQEANEAKKNSLIFGNGFMLNAFVNDTEVLHLAEPMPASDPSMDFPQDPNDGIPQEEQTVKIGGQEPLHWAVKEVMRYKGMKPRSLNPYYVFTDPQATCDENRRFVYLYTLMPLEEAKKFAIVQGWVSEQDADEKIKATSYERFDRIRSTIDVVFSLQAMAYSRGSHIDPLDSLRNMHVEDDRNREPMVLFLERYEKDFYAVSIGESGEVIYADYNVYPHKQIPIVGFWDYKLPDVYEGMGEPEIIRWQQIETNRIHNLVLHGVLMQTVSRFAINSTLMESENDASFWNPFRPIRLKPLPGINVNQAIMALPTPELKQSAFELMGLVQDTVQKTTAANDFVVSSNEAKTNTATESNNLVAATTGRLRDKLRTMERSIKNVVEQWHPCYYTFYGDEMEFELTGENTFIKFLPYNREEANEDPTMIQDAKLSFVQNGFDPNVLAQARTLEDVYMAVGYGLVIFTSDLLGEFSLEAIIGDPELSSSDMIEKKLSALKIMTDINAAAVADPNEHRRFDVFAFGKDALSGFSSIKNVDDYVKDLTQQTPPVGPQPTSPQEGPQPEQAQPSAPPMQAPSAPLQSPSEPLAQQAPPTENMPPTLPIK